MPVLDLNRTNEIFQILSHCDVVVAQDMEIHFLKMEKREFQKEVLLLVNKMFESKELTLYELVRLNQLINKL